MSLPFAEQLFAALLFASLAPGDFGLYQLSRGFFWQGLLALLIWAGAFVWLAIVLHRRKLVRLWISIGAALLVVGAASAMLFEY
jgi:hypothetical protein